MSDARALERAWVRFDRSTAYLCRIRGVPWDRAECRRRWNEYVALIEAAGGRRPPVPTGL